MTKLSSLWDAALAASLVNPHLIISVDKAWRAHEAMQNEINPDRYRNPSKVFHRGNGGVRFDLIQKGIISPCVPTPLIKVSVEGAGEGWMVGVPVYNDIRANDSTGKLTPGYVTAWDGVR